MTQSYPESLKAISIHAPHAYAICMGIKQAEYRTQPTDRRGWILIHASQSKDSDHKIADYGISKDTIKRGAIIGAAQIADCSWDTEFECYAYHLNQPILFDQPLEGIKGCQAIFWGAKTDDRQAAFAQAWEMILAEDAADILIEANPIDITQDLAIPGYYLECEAEHTYQVFDSLTQESLFKIYRNPDGWTNDFSKQTHSSPQAAIAQAREKTIGRIDRSIPLEVEQVDNDTFIVRNPGNNNYYAVRLNHPNFHERCECGDTHFRGVRCKHQIAATDYLEQAIAQAELNQYIEQQAEEIAPTWRQRAEKTYARLLAGEELTIDTPTGVAKIRFEAEAKFGVKHLSIRQSGKGTYNPLMAKDELEKYILDLYNPKIIEAFGTNANPRFLSTEIEFISPDGFYNWEAIVEGQTIATIHYDGEHLTQPYIVAVGSKEIFRWNTQARAENYIRWHYKQGTLPAIEEEKPKPCTIEDCNFTDDKGQQYAFRINNQLIGYIWLDDERGWTLGNGDFYDDWRECGLKLAQITRKDLYQLVAV